MKIISSLLIAFSMYSRIPVPQVQFKKEYMKYVLGFFPVVGLVTAVLMLGWFYFSWMMGLGAAMLAAGAVLLPIAVNGGIHMDGFMDTIDGMCSYGSKEKKLEILKDPHTGAFAILGCGVYLVLAYGLWTEVSELFVPVIGAGYVISRSLSGIGVLLFPKAKQDGSASEFSETARKGASLVMLLLWLAGAAGFLLMYEWKIGILTMSGAGAVFLYYRYKVVPQFGGTTGDLSGYFLQVCEIVILACTAAGKFLF